MRAALVILVVLAGRAVAQPASAPPEARDPSAVLRDANSAATAGDWQRVSALVDPLLSRPLDRADIAEAHRLAGIAAFFQQRSTDADSHFLAYLRFDLDGRLDPTLYPPEVVTFFEDVRARHAAELRALRPRPKRHVVLNLLPPLGQFQNGEHTKGWILGGMLAGFAVANVTSYFVLRSWCVQEMGSAGSSLVCDEHGGAKAVRSIEIIGGVGLIATYLYGVYDGVSTYRRNGRTPVFAPYATPVNEGVMVGVTSFF